MLVKELKKLLKEVDDYAIVVVPIRDHSFKIAKMINDFVVVENSNIVEDYGQNLNSRVDALIIY